MRLLRIACLFIFIFFVCASANAQTGTAVHRELTAVRTNKKIIIDGDIGDSAWRSAAIVNDFTEWQPTFGKQEDPSNETEFYLLYDDDAIYVAGFCHEATNDSISKELVGRDVLGVNDFAGVLFDTYNDQINGFGYYVTPLGEQYDAKYSSVGEDGTWNSVYESQAKIIKGGWTFEMRIPYSAIRFAKKHIQTWGVQFIRRRNKTGSRVVWNPRDPSIGAYVFAQAGLLNGITDIKPPLRLSFVPYLSTYADHYPYNDPNIKNWSTSVNGGMDVKYGINQAFTLDMTLVPDFGQVQSDNNVLNLTPFEIKYTEYRTFFTEGTELFSKGNLFYSRRIGGEPMHYYDVYNDLGSTEIVKENPGMTKLINATKISGRTSSGLGIGFFNALSSATYATIEDTATKKIRTEQTSPLTNYNILVLDQSLKNNSSISLIRTTTIRKGNDYSANVTAGLWDIYDKKNTYEFFGQTAFSQLLGYSSDEKDMNGYSHSITFAKPGGLFNFNVFQYLTDDKYSQNDMGYATNNNFFDNGFFLGRRWLKPTSWYYNLYYNFNFYYSQRFRPNAFQYIDVNTNINGQLKNLWNFFFYFDVISHQNDFYEPRVAGRVYSVPYSYVTDVNVTTDPTKKYYTSVEIAYRHVPKFNGNYADINLTNQYRFNKKLTVSLSNSMQIRNNNVGHVYDTAYASDASEHIYFGMRNRLTLENILNIKYNFTNTMGLSFRTRHYWSRVKYSQFYELNNDGSLAATDKLFGNENVNFFNIDMLYTWQFALGSFINISWKNSIVNEDDAAMYGYMKNLSNTLTAPQNNNFSIKVIYYLDYLNLKKKRTA